MASLPPTPLTSPSSDSLLLSPSSTNATTTRYSNDLARARSRARPIHLVRQALGHPHFGISRAVVAPASSGRDPKPGRRTSAPQAAAAAGKGSPPDSTSCKGKVLRKEEARRPILSRLPLPLQSASVTVVHVQDTLDSEDGQANSSLLAISGTTVPSHSTASDALQWNASCIESSSVPAAVAAAVFYTHTRLPYLSEQDTFLWKALHHLRPVRDDYGRAFREVADQVGRSMDLHRVHPGSSVNRLPQKANDTSESLPPPPPSSSITKCPIGSAKQAAAYVSLIRNAFNWSALPPLPAHTKGEYYGVLFRSTRYTQYLPSSSSSSAAITATATTSSAIGGTAAAAPADDDDPSSALYAADRQAHEEAVESGGLLMYWYGEPDSVGNNVATCVWTGRDDARRASRLEKHRVAAALAGKVYVTYELVRYCVKKVQGETGVRIEVWED